MSLPSKRRLGEPGQQRGLLKGSDLVEHKKTFIDVDVEGIREAPDLWTSPYIIDFQEPVLGKDSMSLNTVNSRKLAAHIIEERQVDDMKQICGGKLRLVLKDTNNPQTGQTTQGLRISKIRLGEKSNLGVTDDDVPF